MAGEKGAVWSSALLALVFNNVAAPNIGNAGGLQPSSVLGSLYIALHTADPTSGGNQGSNEVAYSGYTRATVARGGFTVTGNAVTPTAAVVFPAGTAGSSPTATFFSIGTAFSGAGELLYAGPITPNILCGNGITPELPAATVTEN